MLCHVMHVVAPTYSKDCYCMFLINYSKQFSRAFDRNRWPKKQNPRL